VLLRGARDVRGAAGVPKMALSGIVGGGFAVALIAAQHFILGEEGASSAAKSLTFSS
jgi:hypothetical protein